jgi:hypothetical protein
LPGRSCCGEAAALLRRQPHQLFKLQVHRLKKVIYLFFFFYFPCFPSCIAGLQDTNLVVVGWLDQVAASSTHAAGGDSRLFPGVATNQSPIRLTGWLPHLKVLTSESQEIPPPLFCSCYRSGQVCSCVCCCWLCLALSVRMFVCSNRPWW